MKSSTNDKVEGIAKSATGKVKESAGKLSGNPALKTKGKVEQVEGKTQRKFAESEQAAGH